MYHLVQLIPQHVRTLTAAVSIVNGEQTAFGPITESPFVLRFAYVEDDRDAVFVVGADVPVVGVRSERVQKTILFRGVA